ncbi:MAG TPA: PEGA domain-containing protein [Kofleriaceae bacterium]|nr:PEGA domain-containing protein [Kofleriaceae bacterium]
MLKRALVLLVLVGAVAPAHADRVVAVAPMSTLGAEDKSAATKKLIGQIEQAIGALPGTKVVPATQVAAAIDKAKKPQLKVCEDDPACITEVGKLVGANLVVTGEVGGLGDSRVVYLKSTDVAAGHEVRSTTLAIGGATAADTPAGAAIRLLDPDKYNGVVHFNFDVTGATVLVNGTKVQLSPTKDIALPVGTHAVTVTHPQYHNFVKFVDVTYGKPTEVQVGMKQYPIVEGDIHARPGAKDTIVYKDPPLWRRWYVTGPAIVILAVGAGIVGGIIAHDFPAYTNCRKVGGLDCIAQ